MYLLFPFYLSREDSTLICLGTKQPSIINNANQPTKSQTHPRTIRTPSTAHPCALLSSPLEPSLPPFPHLTHHGRPPQHAHRNRQRQRHHPRRLRRRRPAQMLLPLLRRPAQTPARPGRAQELRGLLKIRYPLEHGIVTDWDDMERIWQYVYTDELKTLSEEVRYFLREIWEGLLGLIEGGERRMLESVV
jgi:hypothetical protein